MFFWGVKGKFEDTIKECSKAIELNPSYMKALVRRGEAHEKLEHFEEAIAGESGFLKFKNGFYLSRRKILIMFCYLQI
jgi:tetratricopeptide (TPR) repeat protein